MEAAPAAIDPRQITRPDPVLRTYYIILAVMTLPGVVITLPLLMFRYATLRYRFDDEGIAVSWGILFRQEVYLTYRRIQDIHVTRGIIQRWLGIATISVQTASGSASAEMQIEGIVQYEALRDALYQRMRGAHHDEDAVAGAGAVPGANAAPGGSEAEDEALELLREIHAELVRQRAASGQGRAS